MTPADAAVSSVGFRHFHDQLSHLKQRLLDMSDLATSLLDLSVDALLSRDANMADAVVTGDRELDALELEVEDQAIGLLALQQPMARDLRFIIASIKVSNAPLPSSTPIRYPSTGHRSVALRWPPGPAR